MGGGGQATAHGGRGRRPLGLDGGRQPRALGGASDSAPLGGPLVVRHASLRRSHMRIRARFFYFSCKAFIHAGFQRFLAFSYVSPR